jgi:hypothetical protein
MRVLVVEDDAEPTETVAVGLRREPGLPSLGDRA